MDINGQIITGWCPDPVEWERMAAVLRAQQLQPVLVNDPAEILAYNPPCAIFYNPPLDDPAFAASCRPLVDRPIEELPMTRIVPRGTKSDKIGGGSLSNLRYNYMVIPYHDEELALRVVRTIQRLLERRANKP